MNNQNFHNLKVYKKIIILFLGIILLSGCVEKNNIENKNPVKPFENVSSIYTSLNEKSCIHLENEDANIPYSKMKCPGIEGYELELVYGDDRESINVISPDGKEHTLNFSEVITPAFSYVGEKAEWRITDENDQKNLKALIIRLNANESVENPDEVTSYLVVSKITPKNICVIGKIEPTANANEEARKIADDADNKPCL